MKILVSNDDGYFAPGISLLAEALRQVGEVTVVAPERDRSGASNSLTLDRPLIVRRAPNGYFSVNGTPTDCVHIAVTGLLEFTPDVVVSGINPGPNTGRSVLHSGTVGAALTAANMGLSGLAVSIGTGDPAHYETAAVVGAGALGWVAAAPPKTVLNVNVPNLPLAEVRGVQPARLAPFGTVRTTLGETVDGRLQVELRETEDELDAGTDTALVVAGYVAVTPLVGIRAAVDVELEAAAAVEEALGLSPAAS